MNQELSRSIAVYSVGFGISLLLSLGAYFIATSPLMLESGMTMLLLLVLAVTQLLVQLYCFLHLRPNRASRSRNATLAFTILMMLIIVVGSIWIMRNLDYRMGMSSEAMNEYMHNQNKKGF